MWSIEKQEEMCRGGGVEEEGRRTSSATHAELGR